MRLINTKTYELKQFHSDVPPYVILSHTWDAEEINFADFETCVAKQFVQQDLKCQKIVRTCQRAEEDGFDWAWIDTCCINKTSSSELSEAINSMYKWYWSAEKCYAYLKDVATEHDLSQEASHIPKWFTRGWTLQELLAPAIVEFYGSEWNLLDTKLNLATSIQRITGIDKKYLLSRRLIGTTNVATKFSWASRRATTRPEDIAYSLLGLFDVNMPLLYGEGTKAFYRLQAEIMSLTDDQTIFTWSSCGQGTSRIRGMLAPSPALFENAIGLTDAHWERGSETGHVLTNRGIRLRTPCWDWGSEYPTREPRDSFVAALHCYDSDGSRIGIPMATQRIFLRPRFFRYAHDLIRIPKNYIDSDPRELYCDINSEFRELYSNRQSVVESLTMDTGRKTEVWTGELVHPTCINVTAATMSLSGDGRSIDTTLRHSRDKRFLLNGIRVGTYSFHSDDLRCLFAIVFGPSGRLYDSVWIKLWKGPVDSFSSSVMSWMKDPGFYIHAKDFINERLEGDIDITATVKRIDRSCGTLAEPVEAEKLELTSIDRTNRWVLRIKITSTKDGILRDQRLGDSGRPRL